MTCIRAVTFKSVGGEELKVFFEGGGVEYRIILTREIRYDFWQEGGFDFLIIFGSNGTVGVQLIPPLQLILPNLGW